MAGAEPLDLTLESPGEEPVRLRYDSGALDPGNGEGGDAARSPWTIEGVLDWRRADSLRLVSARFEDGRELAIASIRPRGADAHGSDLVASRLIEAEGQVEVEETLVSTEYDSAGLPRRLGIELWLAPDSPPLRVAADRLGAVEASGESPRREVARMGFRLAGAGGTGLHEVLRPA